MLFYFKKKKRKRKKKVLNQIKLWLVGFPASLFPHGSSPCLLPSCISRRCSQCQAHSGEQITSSIPGPRQMRYPMNNSSRAREWCLQGQTTACQEKVTWEGLMEIVGSRPGEGGSGSAALWGRSRGFGKRATLGPRKNSRSQCG